MGARWTGCWPGIAIGLQHQFLGFYTESTRRSMVAKFGRFQTFCKAHDLIALPVHPVTIYRYLRFLHEEGRVGVRSLPQYLAAISMVHHSMGHPQFLAFDAVTRRLFRPWMLRVRDPAAAPCWLLGASPLPCRGRNRGARSLNAQWWARSCDRSDVGRLARPMGRGEVVLRGHASGHQRMRLHDGACGPMIWPSC